MNQVLMNIQKEALTQVADMTEEQQEQAVQAVQLVMRAAKLAKEEGLLALESTKELLGNTQSDCYFQKGMEWILNGTEPELLTELMINQYYILSKTIPPLVLLIYLRGILCIQDNTDLNNLNLLLSSMLPPNYINSFETTYEDTLSKQSEEHLRQLEQKFYNQTPSPSLAYADVLLEQFNQTIQSLTPEQMQILLREASNETWTRVLILSDSKTKEFILRNVAPRLRMLLIEDALYLSETEQQTDAETIKDILLILKLHKKLFNPSKPQA